MTKENFAMLISKDSYLKERKPPTPAEEQLYLRETEFHCPLCGKDLRHRKQKKANKLYQIAHIYPNSPTEEQYKELAGLTRLGDNSEAFENKIALCKDCHSAQDYHTSKKEYLTLVKIKEKFLRKTALDEVTFDLGLQQDIAIIIKRICALRTEDFEKLNYSPVPLANKFASNEQMLKSRIAAYVTNYYPYIRDLFRELEGTNGFRMDVLSMQIKCSFAKMEYISNDKDEIFEKLVNWIYTKTLSVSRPACEAVISFFVQNCEVFHEITE